MRLLRLLPSPRFCTALVVAAHAFTSPIYSAALQDLKTTNGALSPSFSESTSAYSLALPASAASLSLRPRASVAGTRFFAQPPNRAWAEFAPGATLAPGRFHALALKVDGSVVAWGNNSAGQTTVPSAALSGVVAVAAGDAHSLALKEDGSVLAWGSNASGQTTVPAEAAAGIVSIAAARDRSFALKADGQLLVWGNNATPPSSFATNVVAIAAGDYHAIALKTDGSVETWSGAAVPPEAQSGVVAIAAKAGRSLALKADGTIVAWGSGSSALLGVPAAANGAIGIALSIDRNFALLPGGGVYAWGDAAPSLLDPPAGAGLGIAAIYASDYQGLALKRDGSLVSWGSGPSDLITPPPAALQGLRLPIDAALSVPYGASQLSLRAHAPAAASPVAMPLASLRNRTFSVAPNGSAGFALVLWNNGTAVRLGSSGYALPSPAPSDLVAISTGNSHALAVRSNGQLVAWGSNGSGQLNAPADAIDLVAVAAGNSHSIAVRRDGRVVVWGSPSGYQTSSLPAGLSTGVVSVTSSGDHNLFVRADGSVAYWGTGSNSLGTLPAQISSGVVAAAVNTNTGVALKDNGTLQAWGYGANLLGSPPPEAADLVSVSLGASHILTLTADGRVVAWGNNSSGQCTVPADALTGVVAIAAAGNASYAIKSDGSIVSWGASPVVASNPDADILVPPAVSDTSIQPVVDLGAPRVPLAVANSTALRLSSAGAPATFPTFSNPTPPTGLTGLIAIASGENYALGLRPHGEVIGWGSYSSVLDIPYAARSDVVSLSAGPNHALALKKDGSVVAWGNSGSGQATVPDLNPGTTASSRYVFTAVAAAESTSFGLRSDGRVIAWGSPTYNLTVVPTPALSGVVAIAAGYRHALALRGDGTAIGWGYDQSTTYTAYNFGAPIVAIAAGYDYSVFLLSNGAVRVLASGTSFVPASIPAAAESGVVAISAGRNRIATLKADGSVVTWSSASDAQTISGPTLRSGPPGEQIDLAISRAYASPAPASLTLSSGALSPAFDPDTTRYTQAVASHVAGLVLAPRPVDLPAAITVSLNGGTAQRLALGASLAGGFNFNVGLTPAGAATVWNSTSFNLNTIPAAAQSGVVAVAAGETHALALKSDGSLVTWGSATTSNSLGQIPATAASGIVAISAGSSHSLALRRDGAVVAWGTSSAAQSPVPEQARSGVAAIAAGSFHNLALKTDGSVFGWGSTGTPPSTVSSGVVAVAAGDSFSLALKNDGSVVGWDGASSGGSLAPPASLGSRIVAISAGRRHAMALRDDGAVLVWGEGASSLLTVPATAAGAIAVAAGRDHCSVLREDGSVVTWGNFSTGQNDALVRLAYPLNARLALRTGVNRIDYTTTAEGGVPLAATPMVAGASRHWFINHLGQPDSMPSRSGVSPSTPNSQIYAAPVSTIASGGLGEYGVRLDGSVVTISGSTAPFDFSPSNTSTTRPRVRRLAVNDSSALALLEDGSLRTWGSTTTLPTVAQGRFLAVAAGRFHLLALRADGRVVSWSSSSLPAALEPPASVSSGVIAIAGGENFSLALKTDGSVVAWGQSFDPVVNAVPALTGVRAIAAGERHALALHENGTLTAWGDNGFSQRTVPTSAQTDIVAIAAAAHHSLALKADGSVIAWGNSALSPTGLRLLTAPQRTYSLNVTRALEIPGLARLGTSVGAVSPSVAPTTFAYDRAAPYAASHVTLSAALTGFGQARVSFNGGSSIFAPLGHSVALGGGFLVAINYAGGAVVSSSTQLSPTPASAESEVVSVAAGSTHALILRADGVPITWGTSSTPPATLQIPGAALSEIVAVSAYGFNSLALRRDGTAVAWGTSSFASSVTQNLGASNVAIALGGNHALALKSDGSVVASPTSFPLTASAQSDVVAIAAGSDFGLGLKSDGSVVSWGNRASINAVPVAALSGVVAIAAGQGHALALRSDGSLVTWGDDNSAVLSIPSSAHGRAITIAAGSNGSAILTASGTVVTWGSAQFQSVNWPVAPPLSALQKPREGSNRLDLRLFAAGVPTVHQATLAAGSVFNLAVSPLGAASLAPVATGGPAPGTLPTAAQSGVGGVYARDTRLFALKTSGAVVSLTGSSVPWIVNPSNAGSPSFVAARALAVGNNDTLALLVDGSVIAFGNDNVVPAAARSGVTAIAANGSNRFFALRSEGHVLAWNSSGVLDTTLPATTQSGVVALAAGGNHGLVLKADGTVFAWNYNSPAASSPLTQIPADATDILAIAAAEDHFLALRRDGRIISWGNLAPLNTVPTAAQSGIVALAAGPAHALALHESGDLVTWGYTPLGNGVPVATGLSAPTPGPTRTYTLTLDRELGVPGLDLLASPTAALSPAFSPSTLDYTFATTPYPALGLIGRLRGPLGQIELSNYFNEPFRPRMPGPTLALTDGAILALRPDGGVRGFGSGSVLPVPAAAQSEVLALAAGRSHAVALKRDGSLFAWGDSSYGKTLAPSGNDFVAIAAGEEHSLALRSNGQVVAWSTFSTAQLQIPATATDVVSIAAGTYTSIALRRDGSVVTWGNYSSPPVPTAAQSGVIAVAAGSNHFLALKQSGEVVQWGYFGAGFDTPPTHGIVAIAAADGHNIALRADGSIVTWAYQTSTYVSLPSDTNADFAAISLNRNHGAALKQDGSIIAFPRYSTPLQAGNGSPDYAGPFALPLGARTPLALGGNTVRLRFSRFDAATDPVVYTFVGDRAPAPAMKVVAGTNPAASPIFNQTFPASVLGTNATATLTLVNPGTAPLVVSAAPIAGTHAADFAFGGATLPLTLAPGESAPFHVTATPSAAGLRYGVLSLLTNLTGGDVYFVGLRGEGLSVDSEIAAWRGARFTAEQLADPALEASVWGDTADPDGNGLPNLLEYALALPAGSGASAPTTLTSNEPPAPGQPATLTLTYTRSKRAFAAGLIYRVESSGTLDAASWTAVFAPEALLASDADTESIAVTVPADTPTKFLRLRVERPAENPAP